MDNTSFSHALSYTTIGDGPPIVLLHGIASSHQEWTDIAHELVRQGFQCLLPDLFGHGGSQKPANINLYTSQYQIQLTTRWLRKLTTDSRFDIIGHSFGGYLALHLASQLPTKVRNVVVINPFYDYQQLSAFHALVFSNSDIVIRIWKSFRCFLNPNLPSPFILNIPLDINHHAVRFGKIHEQVMIIFGDKDKTLRPVSFHSLAKQLPNATVKLIPKAGHTMHISQPQKVSRLIKEFIDSHKQTIING